MSERPKLGRLSKLGIESLGELMYLVPMRYKDFSNVFHSFEAASGKGKVCMAVAVLSKAAYDKNKNRVNPGGQGAKAIRLSLSVQDGEGRTGYINVFGNLWPWRDIERDSEIVVYGEVGEWKGTPSMTGVELLDAPVLGRIMPVYRQKPRVITSNTIAGIASSALHAGGVQEAVEMLEQSFGRPESEIMALARVEYPGLRPLLIDLHAPQTVADALRAKSCAKRLSAALVVHQGRMVMNRPPSPASVIEIDRTLLKQYADALPFGLTDDQRAAINEIVADLTSEKPMRRLLSGDVGTGKTLAFLLPALAARQSGAAVAIFLPTSMVVDQVEELLLQYFPSVPYEVVTDERKPKGGVQGKPLIIGTSAVQHWAKKTKWQPDLVIVDEQHKHSRQFRESLLLPHTNLLEATGTAVPRSVALVSHGGMDVSILSQCPVRKSITTRLIGKEEEGRLLDFLGKVIEREGQVGIVYARVEKGQDGPLSIEEELPKWHRFFKGRVGVIHGRLDPDEKRSVADKLKLRQLDGVVASTAIELGITLPALRSVVIVNPEQHGMSTLHQLRGRTVRNGGKGHCFLYCPAEITEDQRSRLEAVARCDDGFTLAVEDMRQRGYGDLSESSELQSGSTGLLFNGISISADDLATVA